MKAHPIIFSGEMIKAILDGRKTQTRRVIKPQPYPSKMGDGLWGVKTEPSQKAMALINATPADVKHWCLQWHRYDPGDHLWVRETWCINQSYDGGSPKLAKIAMGDDTAYCVNYRATPRDGDFWGRWRPSIFMPRWASRITLEVERVWVGRVQDISEEDTIAEGIYKHYDPHAWTYLWDESLGPQWYGEARFAFRALWDSTNAKKGYSWDVNPWCWCIEFSNLDRRHK